MNKGESSASAGNKPERKTTERNQRVRMKNLCNELVSIIPDHHFKQAKEFLSVQDQIEQATLYIKTLRERVEELRRRKTQLALMTSHCGTNNAVNMGGSNLPVLKIRESGSSLEVVLISGIKKNFMLNQVISLIEQEGAEVVTVNLSNDVEKIFLALHAKVKFLRIGMDIVNIGQKIHDLLQVKTQSSLPKIITLTNK